MDDLNARGVRVKPLEWGNGEGEIVTADYAISAESGTWFAFRRGTLLGHGATLEAAKAAAQADYEARITAALDLAPLPAAPQGWQPMATAPKDGRELICCDSRVGGGHLTIVSWEDDLWWSSEALGYGDEFFTHWRPCDAPLPAPVKGE